ncbi:hypothetical protein E5134_10750 [Pasteurella multocida]|uniref:hypothetical protein n=2 Tax=Pasteurella multocida TaxID=747 RepID=UPI0007F91A5C|nr:hypothetical protein [Pasteurella multocida]OBP21263.1 hypothetical protein A0R64_08200 [Pasteurella multocida subsp. multocida]QCA34452.1 hypothetical protein E5134_10750 [Pasteurella multocida]HDX1097022.1 hypothetical protein [Pasteurella multocida]HDX1167871.1 hypothetical protein [Pasteurella multocida]
MMNKRMTAIIKFIFSVGVCFLVVYGCVWLYFFSPSHFETTIAQLARLQGYPLAYQALFNQIYQIALLIGVHFAIVVYAIRFLYIRRK